MNLIDELTKLFKCEKNALQDYLNHPASINKVDEHLKGLRLRTTYFSRTGERKEIKYATISLKSAMEQHAYEGYLNVSVQQHFYCRHRIRLMYPRLKCVVEYQKSGHYKYYPLELLEIVPSEEIAATSSTSWEYDWPSKSVSKEKLSESKAFDTSMPPPTWYTSSLY